MLNSHRHVRTTATRRNRRSNRRGAVLVELILAFPVLLVVLLAVIEFGLIQSNLQQIALASRVGAEEASQTATVALSGSGAVPANILAAIDKQLASSGLSQCKVTVQHNVGTPGTRMTGACDCGTPSTPTPATPSYVRVTVCVELAELTPNLLQIFGFDTAGKVVEHTTTFRHEL